MALSKATCKERLKTMNKSSIKKRNYSVARVRQSIANWLQRNVIDPCLIPSEPL